jgi:hypothetical protein
VVLTTHPQLAPGSRMSTAIPLLPLWAFMACSRENFTLLYYGKQRSYQNDDNYDDDNNHTSWNRLVRERRCGYCDYKIQISLGCTTSINSLTKSMEQSPFKKLTLPQLVKEFPAFHYVSLPSLQFLQHSLPISNKSPTNAQKPSIKVLN